MLYPDAWKGTIPDELKRVAGAGGTLQLSVGAFLSLEHLLHLAHSQWIAPAKLRVWDPACGTGESLALSAVRYPETQFAASEPEEDSLIQAKAYMTELGLSNVSFEPEDLFQLIRPTRPLNQLENVAGKLAEWAGMLAAPGVVAITAEARFDGARVEALQLAAECLRTPESSAEALDVAMKQVLGVLAEPGKADLWNVPDLSHLAKRSGLRIAAFLHPWNYTPLRFLSSEALVRIVEPLSLVEKAWLTEVILGQPTVHHLLLIPDGAETVRLSMEDAAAAGYLPRPSPYMKVESTSDGRFRFVMNKTHLLLHPALTLEEIEAPAQMLSILQAMDGAKNFEQLHRRFLPLTWDVFWYFMKLLAENDMIYLYREEKKHGTV